MKGSANTEEFREILQKFKIFAKILQGFCKFFVRDSIAKHMYSQLFAHFLIFCSPCD